MSIKIYVDYGESETTSKHQASNGRGWFGAWILSSLLRLARPRPTTPTARLSTMRPRR